MQSKRLSLDQVMPVMTGVDPHVREESAGLKLLTKRGDVAQPNGQGHGKNQHEPEKESVSTNQHGKSRIAGAGSGQKSNLDRDDPLDRCSRPEVVLTWRWKPSLGARWRPCPGDPPQKGRRDGQDRSEINTVFGVHCRETLNPSLAGPLHGSEQ